MSSLNKISTDSNPKPPTFLQQAYEQISKDDVNGFYSNLAYLLHGWLGQNTQTLPPFHIFQKWPRIGGVENQEGLGHCTSIEKGYR
jgi:hypothetical protein